MQLKFFIVCKVKAQLIIVGLLDGSRNFTWFVQEPVLGKVK